MKKKIVRTRADFERANKMFQYEFVNRIHRPGVPDSKTYVVVGPRIDARADLADMKKTLMKDRKKT